MVHDGFREREFRAGEASVREFGLPVPPFTDPRAFHVRGPEGTGPAVPLMQYSKADRAALRDAVVAVLGGDLGR